MHGWGEGGGGSPVSSDTRSIAVALSQQLGGMLLLCNNPLYFRCLVSCCRKFTAQWRDGFVGPTCQVGGGRGSKGCGGCHCCGLFLSPLGLCAGPTRRGGGGGAFIGECGRRVYGLQPAWPGKSFLVNACSEQRETCKQCLERREPEALGSGGCVLFP